MRAILISPYSHGPARGNITTVNRIRQYLQEAGAEILVLPLDGMPPERIGAEALRFAPDVVHAFNAHYCGDVAAGLAERMKRQLAVTITGSDICDEALRGHPSTARALARAAAVVCFSSAEAGLVAGHFPEAATRCVVIPQGFELPTDPGNGIVIPDDMPFVLLPAALRPVKNIESAIRATEGLRVNGLPLRLLLAGGVIDRDYAAMICDRLSWSPWVRWIGEVPRDEMVSLYRQAEVVLNCSFYEAMPNSLMEAMVLGRPVLAADIPGNRALVRHGETGWLYGSDADFRDKLMGVLDNPALRTACGANAERYIRENHDPRQEARSYLNLYRLLVRAEM